MISQNKLYYMDRKTFGND